MTLMPQKVAPVPNEQDVAWAPELVWTFWKIKSYCPCQKSNHRPSNLQQNHYAQYGIRSPHPRGSSCGVCGEQSGKVQVFMQVSQTKTFKVLSNKFSVNIIRTALSHFNRSTTHKLFVSHPCLCLLSTATHSRFLIFVTLSRVSFDLTF